MDKCIIKSAEKPCGNCLTRIAPTTYQKVAEISLKTGRSITSVTSELLDFALVRVEIDYQYKDTDASAAAE